MPLLYSQPLLYPFSQPPQSPPLNVHCNQSSFTLCTWGAWLAVSLSTQLSVPKAHYVVPTTKYLLPTTHAPVHSSEFPVQFGNTKRVFWGWSRMGASGGSEVNLNRAPNNFKLACKLEGQRHSVVWVTRKRVELKNGGKNKNLCSPRNLLQAVTYMFMGSISGRGRMDWLLHMPLQFRAMINSWGVIFDITRIRLTSWARGSLSVYQHGLLDCLLVFIIKLCTLFCCIWPCCCYKVALSCNEQQPTNSRQIQVRC